MDAAAVTAGIEAGDFDDDLSDLLDAIGARIKDGAVEIGWRISFGGMTIDTENQTVAEARLVENVLKEPIGRVPVADSATILSTLIAAALIERKGLKPDAAFVEIGKHTARDLLGSVSKYVIGDPPKEGSAPEMPAS